MSSTEPTAVPDRIICVDCLGECGRISYRPDDDPFQPGDVVSYRCRDCNDRWDIVLEVEDFGPGATDLGPAPGDLGPAPGTV